LLDLALSIHFEDMSTFQFAGATVIVTGAAAGIGLATAQAFISSGARVFGVDIDANALGHASENNSLFRGLIADVTEESAIKECIKVILDETSRIDVLVNNAGINMPKRIDALEPHDWDRVMNVSLKSSYIFSKAVWPTFQRFQKGAIVNISSIMGKVGGVNSPAYCSAKAALLMLTRCLAKDGASNGIRVNSISPGYVDTPIMDRVFASHENPTNARKSVESKQPFGRMARPEEIANGVLFLASDLASYISGSDLTVDGAFTATQID
jgi:NAD(P)-dependent dehydrogenase (short-subunit alcohol dehydrogenase family)